MMSMGSIVNEGSKTTTGSSSSFLGTSRRIDGLSSKLTAPLRDDEKFILDVHAPHAIPKEKAFFNSRWNWHPKGAEGELDMGAIGIVDAFAGLKYGSGSMVDAEIHLIYLPHLPVELYRQHNVEIVLDFIGTDGEDRMLAKAVFPSPLHSHVIFYPGHSFSVKRGSKYPWRLRILTTADVREDYPIADVIVMLKGYNTPLSQHSEKNGADIISLVPSSNVPTGITLTRPRGDGEWVMKGLRYGLRSQKDLNAIMKIQEAGIDVEGLKLVGRLSDAIKAVSKIHGDVDTSQLNTDQHQRIRNAVFPLLTKK